MVLKTESGEMINVFPDNLDGLSEYDIFRTFNKWANIITENEKDMTPEEIEVAWQVYEFECHYLRDRCLTGSETNNIGTIKEEPYALRCVG